MNKLIVGPLRQSAISTVIVIDALDECEAEEPVSAILDILGYLVPQIPRVKFLLTSRPQPRIRQGFPPPLLAEATVFLALHEVEPSQTYNDIRLFFRHNFSKLADRRGGLDNWPTKELLNLLCERAAGLFIFAVATVKFIDHKFRNPREQLDKILQSPESSVFEGGTLDSLYMTTLLEAFSLNDTRDDHKLRSVLGAAFLATTPLSLPSIAMLLGFSNEDVFSILQLASSLLILQYDPHSPVLPFHKSFYDFVIDSTRCTDERFHIPPPGYHTELLVGCLKLMNQILEKNMCKLPDAVMNWEVDDLKDRIKQYLSPALQYACKSWYKHLIDMDTAQRPVITSALHHFLEKKFLFWLEVLSVLGVARNAVDALGVALKWLEVC